MEENLPVYLFHQGTNYRAYEFLGAHFGRSKGRKGSVFQNLGAARGGCIRRGDFNGWDPERNPMDG